MSTALFVAGAYARTTTGYDKTGVVRSIALSLVRVERVSVVEKRGVRERSIVRSIQSQSGSINLKLNRNTCAYRGVSVLGRKGHSIGV
jgi:hypothetical protein